MPKSLHPSSSSEVTCNDRTDAPASTALTRTMSEG
jgi:hypothetical protein